MSKKIIIISSVLVLFLLQPLLADKLITVDRQEYDGKMVAFKFNTIFFNVYKFGKIYRTRRFPLYEVWKIEFNAPRKEGLESSFEMESPYNKLRRGKKIKKVTLEGTERWVDTGLTLKIGQEILFSASGSIYIDKDNRVYQNGESVLNWNTKKPLPNQPTGAIIARVGKGEPFYVGDDKAPFQIDQKGNLFIGVNDFDFSDNTGQFTVTIYY